MSYRKREAIEAGVNGKPIAVVLPVVTGTATVGQVLTTTIGGWLGLSPMTPVYAWLNNGVVIGGATSATYTLQAGDSTDLVSSQVTMTNAAGSTAAVSAPRLIA